jgi:hypothetical protein
MKIVSDIDIYDVLNIETKYHDVCANSAKRYTVVCPRLICNDPSTFIYKHSSNVYIV